MNVIFKKIREQTYLTRPLRIWLCMCLIARSALFLLAPLKIHPLSTSWSEVRMRTVFDSSHPPVNVAEAPERGSTHSFNNHSIALLLAWLASDKATVRKYQNSSRSKRIPWEMAKWLRYLDNGRAGSGPALKSRKCRNAAFHPQAFFDDPSGTDLFQFSTTSIYNVTDVWRRLLTDMQGHDLVFYLENPQIENNWDFPRLNTQVQGQMCNC